MLEPVPDMKPEWLADVASARAHAEQARHRALAAQLVLEAAVWDAREAGASLADIASELGTTRQYVQKLLRKRAEKEREREEYEAYMARPMHSKPLGRMSGWHETPQCGGCKRILKRPGDVCPSCGYAGHGGYVGVPATTSYLERYR